MGIDGFGKLLIKHMERYYEKEKKEDELAKIMDLSDLVKLCPTITFQTFGKPRQHVPYREFGREELLYGGNAVDMIEEAMRTLGTKDLIFGLYDDQDKYWVQPKPDARPIEPALKKAKDYKDYYESNPLWKRLSENPWEPPPVIWEPPPVIPVPPELKAEPPAPVVIDKGFQLALQMIEELEVDNWEVIVRKLSELYIIKQQAGSGGK